MKIAKLVLMAPVLVTCLALAAASTAQVKRVRSAGMVLGEVSLRKYRMSEQKIVEVLEANGVLRLGGEIVEKLCFEDGSVYLPGDSDRVKVEIKDGMICAGGKQARAVILTHVGKLPWGIECACYGSPILPGPPPPPSPILKYPRDPVYHPGSPMKKTPTQVN